MVFLSPIWLLGLLPWAAVVIYVLRGRFPRAAVPFLALWAGLITVAKSRRHLHRPPLFLALLLMTMLLALLAAAGPKLRGRGSTALVTIILDRGVTMSPAV